MFEASFAFYLFVRLIILYSIFDPVSTVLRSVYHAVVEIGDRGVKNGAQSASVFRGAKGGAFLGVGEKAALNKDGGMIYLA